jgi:hypothetical protein
MVCCEGRRVTSFHTCICLHTGSSEVIVGQSLTAQQGCAIDVELTAGSVRAHVLHLERGATGSSMLLAAANDPVASDADACSAALEQLGRPCRQVEIRRHVEYVSCINDVAEHMAGILLHTAHYEALSRF